MTVTDDELDDLVGWTGPAVEVPIERGRIRDFAEATFVDDPLYRDVAEARSQGYADVPCPPTFFGALFYYDEEHRPELPFDRADVLHGEMSFEYDRVPVANETLYGKVRVTDWFRTAAADGRTITGVESETVFRDETGERVLRAAKTILEVSEE